MSIEHEGRSTTPAAPAESGLDTEQRKAEIQAEAAKVRSTLEALKVKAETQMNTTADIADNVLNHDQEHFGGAVSSQKAFDRAMGLRDLVEGEQQRLLAACTVLLDQLEKVSREKQIAIDTPNSNNEIYTRAELFTMVGAMGKLNDLAHKSQSAVSQAQYDQIFSFFECAVSDWNARVTYSDIRAQASKDKATEEDSFAQNLDSHLTQHKFKFSAGNPYGSPHAPLSIKKPQE